MKKILGIILVSLIFLTGCGAGSQAGFEVKMDLTENYSVAEPFIDERLFYVTDNTNEIKIEFAIEFDGQNGTLEIADNKTKNVIWRDTWDETVKNTNVTATLGSLEKNKEYVIKFTGNGIKKAEIIITSDSSFIKERERPIK